MRLFYDLISDFENNEISKKVFLKEIRERINRVRTALFLKEEFDFKIEESILEIREALMNTEELLNKENCSKRVTGDFLEVRKKVLQVEKVLFKKNSLSGFIGRVRKTTHEIDILKSTLPKKKGKVKFIIEDAIDKLESQENKDFSDVFLKYSRKYNKSLKELRTIMIEREGEATPEKIAKLLRLDVVQVNQLLEIIEKEEIIVTASPREKQKGFFSEAIDAMIQEEKEWEKAILLYKSMKKDKTK